MESHLLQMRGLKQNLGGNNALYRMSHLLQMRGLKLAFIPGMIFLCVASFTDAWIETLCPFTPNIGRAVASFTDAWIETRPESIV